MYKAILDYFLKKIPNSYLGTVNINPIFDTMLVLNIDYKVEHLIWRHIPDNMIFVRKELNGDGSEINMGDPNSLVNIEQSILEFIKKAER